VLLNDVLSASHDIRCASSLFSRRSAEKSQAYVIPFKRKPGVRDVRQRATERLARDLMELEGCGHKSIAAQPCGDDLFSWCATITSDSGTSWHLHLEFPKEFPEKPPEAIH